jgi:MFS family permease
MDFVFSRIALMSQTTAITFYLKLVCGYVGETDTETPWQMAFAPAVSFMASLFWSVIIQEGLQDYHCYSKYNLFLYSIICFFFAAIMLYSMVENDPLWTPLLLYPALVLQGFALANMLNTSTSLVSEMIGQDDHASAVVFASLNIVESFANGGVVFVIMSYSLNDDPGCLKFVIAIIPIMACIGAYIISYLRFKNIAYEY